MMEALQSGAAADAAADTVEQATPVAAQVSPTGDDATTQQQVQPVEPVAPVAQNTDLFEGTQINPDELPAELQPLVKQLQAAFTQKTQSLAAERTQIEALGDIESLQQAVELFDRINDPSNWGQLYQELTVAMQQQGMTPAEAQVAATQVVQQEQAAALNLDSIDDPDLAPLVQQLKTQQAELDQLKSARQEEQQNAQAEYERQAFLGELQRQENAVRAAHPDWDDNKVLAVYQMSSFFGGNLAPAAEALSKLLSGERELYLNQKAAAATETGRIAAPRGAGQQSEHVSDPQTIREAEAEALEFFNARVAQLDQ